jgi:hypothetical protein
MTPTTIDTEAPAEERALVLRGRLVPLPTQRGDGGAPRQGSGDEPERQGLKGATPMMKRAGPTCTEPAPPAERPAVARPTGAAGVRVVPAACGLRSLQ